MGKYDDIINLPHHESKNHPKMNSTNRAAQFAPFAALVGFSESIRSSEEVLDKYIELSEERKLEIERVLKSISLKIKDSPSIEITYYQKNQNSQKGKYLTYRGKIKKIDEFEKNITFTNKKTISLKDIYNIREIYE